MSGQTNTPATESERWAQHVGEAWQQAIKDTKGIEETYNEILTALDQALKIPPLEETTSLLRKLRSDLNELYKVKSAFRKDSGTPYSWRWWLHRFSPFFWLRKLSELIVAPLLVRQQEFNSAAVHYLSEAADNLATANERLMAVHQLLGVFCLQITPWIDVKIREIRTEQSYSLANYNDLLQKQLEGIHVLIGPIGILEQQTIQIQRELEDLWHGLQKMDGFIPHILRTTEDQANQTANQAHQLGELQAQLSQYRQLDEQMHLQIRQSIDSYQDQTANQANQLGELQAQLSQYRQLDEQMHLQIRQGIHERQDQTANQVHQLGEQIQLQSQQSIHGYQELRQLVESFEERYYPAIRVESFDLERLRTDIDQLKNRLPVPAQSAVEYGRPAKPWEFPKSRDLRYLVFEEIFRGSSEWLKKKIVPYGDIFKDAPEPILDIGCGRGEFLELMREAGKDAYGVEMNQYETERLQKNGIHVVREDAITHINGLPDASIGGVFCAQVVEHLTPEDVYQLVTSLQGKMKNGAPLVIETLNPLSVQAFHGFYLVDPSHIYPVHPQTLVFFLRYAGFMNVQVKKITPFPQETRLSNPDQIKDKNTKQYLNALVQRLNSILYDSAEYYVLGYKS